MAANGGSHVQFTEPPPDKTDELATSSTRSVPPPPPSTAPPAAAAASPGSTPKFQAKNLRGNLMREIVDRDPLFNYEVISVLGVGSMGSVAKVRKRGSAIGGSARKELRDHFRRERKLKECAAIPFFGSIFKHCLKALWRDDLGSSDGVDASTHSSGTSSILSPRANALERVESLDTADSKYELIYAMKSIHLSRVTDPTFIEELRNEVRILKRLDHPHIVRPIETYEHRNQLFMVMENCSGGDLYSRDPYVEPEAARIVSSILSAISYMHSKNISHRDLKYENILFINDSPKAEIKLIDFGLSKRFGKEKLTEGVGTIYTMAPEVLKGQYTKQADIWSVGVITYMLLSSQMPFYGRKRRHIVEALMKGSFDFKGRRWKRLSAQSKEFIKDLLVVDPDERLDADEALGSMWLNRRMAATVRNPYEEEIEDAHQSLMNFAGYSKLKKVALLVVAHKSSSQEIGILRKVFQKYDTRRDGQLSFEEFKAALEDAGYKGSDFQQIFDAVDLDGTGQIRYTEFLAATIEAQGAISEERLAEAFDRLDADDSGFISAANIRALLGEEFPMSEIDSIINEADLTRDGKISYSEFLALWEDKNEDKFEESMKEVQFLVHNHDSDRSSVISELISEDEGPEVVARANFVSGKKLSERRASVREDDKHVGFMEEIHTIPMVLSEEGEVAEATGGGGAVKLKQKMTL